MADTNKKDEAQKSDSNPEEDKTQSVTAPSAANADVAEEDGVDVDEEEYDDDEDDDVDGEDDVDEEEPEPEETKAVEELAENAKNKGKKPKQTANGSEPESSTKKKSAKRVQSMGMVFMCTSKTKTDCFRYNVLGLPGNKKDQVAKIYKGMRLFLFDVDLRLMYGIFKAAGPGGYNLEPKAFKSDFPSQVRFTVLEDCLPLAEENFKDVLKENYYSRKKFEGLLKAEQVRNLCKLFVDMGRGRSGARPKPGAKPRRTRPVERTRPGDSHTRKRRPREEERRPRSPPRREKRRYSDYEHERERPVLYHREPPVSRYLPPPLPPHRPPPAALSPVRLYTYERPLDIPPPYIHDRVPEHHHTYRVDPPYAPSYREPVYTLPPEYHLVSREYNPPVIQTPEYHLSGGSRVSGYRDIGLASDYRSSAASLPEYRSRTHYRY